MPHASLTRRAVLAAAVLTTTSACRLRLEHDAPIPGPTAEPAPDSAPLEAVRAHLVETMTAASHESRYVKEAAAAQQAHTTQLARLDATLTGIGASALPRATATAAPTSSSASGSPSGSASASGSGAATASASPSSSASSSSSAPTTWTRAEADWASARTCANLQKVSSTSRPLALAIAARGIAALPTGLDATWSSSASLRPATGLLEATEVTIHALEWWAARTPVDDRGPLGARLSALYAVRSLIEASSPQAARSATDPARRYDSVDAARSDAGKAAAAMLSACATTARTTRDANEVNGLLLAWSSAARTAQLAGASLTPFPGLAT